MDLVEYEIRFPNEILEKIFSYLDGVSFTRAKGVCKKWREIIERMSQDLNMWRQFCDSEIPEYVAVELAHFRSKNQHSKNDCYMLYKSWWRSQIVLNQEYVTEVTDCSDANQSAGSKHVICSLISGNYIFVGNDLKILTAFDVSQNRVVWQHEFDTELSYLAGIRIMNQDDPSPGYHHIGILRKGTFHVLSLLQSSKWEFVWSYTNSTLFSSGNSLSAFNDVFAVKAEVYIAILFERENDPGEGAAYRSIIVHGFFPFAVGLLNVWHSQLSCITSAGYSTYCDIPRDVDSFMAEWERNNFIEEIQGFTTVDDVCFYSGTGALMFIEKSYIFRNQVIVLLLSDNSIFIYVDADKQMQCHLFPILRTNITSLLLYGTLFLLGGDDGKVYVYYTSTIEKLLQIDFSKPQHILNSGLVSPVINIHAAFDSISPAILFSVQSKVFLFKWKFSESSNDLENKAIRSC